MLGKTQGEFVKRAVGLLVLVLALVACVPGAAPDRGPGIRDYNPYFNLAANGQAVSRDDGGWVYEADGYRLTLRTGEPTRVLDAWPGPSVIHISLLNTGNEPILLRWEESSITSPEGSSSRVIHSGVRFIDRDNPQPPTVVAPGARLDDLLLPADNISYDQNEWMVFPVFTYDGTRPVTFRIYLTLQVGDQTERVDLTFTSNSP